MPKQMKMISLKDIMKGSAAPRRLAPAPAAPPAAPPAGAEGGKINLKKVGKQIGRVYRRHGRPIVTQAARQLIPVAKKMATESISNALASQGVPPALVKPLATAAADAADAAARKMANEAGVTEGLGLRRVQPIRMGQRPTLQGHGLPQYMRSRPDLAHSLQDPGDVGYNFPSRPELGSELPPFMRSTTFTNQQLPNAAHSPVSGSGLYPGGGRRGGSMVCGSGLFLPPSGSGLFL